MREVPIRLNLPDQEQVDPRGQALDNLVVTLLGIKPRQGAKEFEDTSSGVSITGAWHWQSQDRVIVTSGTDVFSIVEGTIGVGSAILLEDGTDMLLENGSVADLEPLFTVSDVSNDALIAGNRVTFADFGTYLYMACGNKIKELHASASQVTHSGTDYKAILNNYNVTPPNATYWTTIGATGGDAWSATTRYGSGTADDLEDASWPTTVFFIASADRYLLALEDGTHRIHYSFPSEPWRSDGDFVSAEHKPDAANCMIVADGDVWVGGFRSIQNFQNTPTSAWLPSAYGAYHNGVLAPYTFIYVQGSLYFIDSKRRFVTLPGRTAVPLNRSIDTWLNTIDTIADATADYFVTDGINYILLQFPSSNKAIQINLDNGSWSEVTNANDRIDLTTVINVPDWDVVLGGNATGKILDVSTKYRTDDGTTIDSVIRSPRMQVEASAYRVVVGSLIVALTKLTTSSETGSASFTVRYRDDEGDWSSVRTYSMSNDSVTDVVAHLWRMGSYRENRQYEIDLSDLYPYSISKVIER